MLEEMNSPGTIDSTEREAMYAISQAAARAVEIEAALDEILKLARPVFVFDNAVLYRQQRSNNLEPSFARAIGRGRSEEADLAWGEAVSSEAFRTGQVVVRHEINAGSSNNRLQLRLFLGLPMSIGDHQTGALVFVRYGGPPYTPEQIHLAEFIAAQVAQVLEHRQLVGRLADLEAERRLERLQDDFVATISHELRTPLGFIKGYATTLLRDDTIWEEETRREFLSIIDEEADRLRELIDNLLDSSRLQSGTLRMEFQPLRLDTMLRDMLLRTRSYHENLTIELRLEGTGLQVQADPTRLAQVFDNLFSNAVKYAPGSNVIISLDRSDDSRAHISVQDQGPGIPPEHLDHIFTRFYRVPGKAAAVRGTGLGLFICRRIIRAHGGDISAESVVGKGTTFHIYLPCEPLASE
jgi:signal transduction histidine kinase